MKRHLFLVHRWLGIVLGLFMVMWFASGIVMMYVGYPKLTVAERVAALPALDLPAGTPGPGGAIIAAGKAEPPQSVRLTSIGGEAYYVLTWKEGVAAVHAASGRPLGAVEGAQAMASARAFIPGARAVYDALVEEDAWTHSRALDPHRPLHRVAMDDARGMVLYVSGRTGEVVRDASRIERSWNWAGAWIHWLYPFRGNLLDRHWHDMVVWISIAATLLAATGVTIGVMRWRFRGAYRSGSRSPYRTTFARWHHVGGMLFGCLALTWIFSGLMSMNPWKLFSSAAPALHEEAMAGAPLSAAHLSADVAEPIRRFRAAGFAPRELEWTVFDGRGWVVARNAGGRTRIAPISGDMPPREMLDLDALAAAGARLLPGARVVARTDLRDWDAYHYTRAPHTMTGHVEKRLPVVRLEFDDPYRTWVHLDPYTGRVAARLDTRQRVKRWLFAFLHSWDWDPLLAHRPAWDALLIGLSAGGLAIAGTGVTMGWRRLRLRRRRG